MVNSNIHVIKLEKLGTTNSSQIFKCQIEGVQGVYAAKTRQLSGTL